MNYCALLCSAMLWFAPASQAQGGVRLARVPEVVRLPAAPGTNLLLEVEIDGVPTAVWLATDAVSRDRVPLTHVGDRRWQLNLADARVAAMVPAGRDDGTLTVFATIAGATQQTTAIAWARATIDDAKVRCLVRRSDGTTRTFVAFQRGWLDLAHVERLELHGVSARQSACVARAGDHEMPLVRRADAGTWVLAIDPAMQERMHDAETLEVEAKQGAECVLFPLALVPPKLALGDASSEFVVQQRKRAKVPGTRGWLVVDIDDITRGSTLLRVRDAEGREVVSQQVLSARDFVEVALPKERCVIVVDQLMNQLIGDDHAVLHVQRSEGFVPDRIAQLIRAVGAATATFLRNGQEYEPAAARQFLINKLPTHVGPALTVDQFVDTFASTSSQTGQPYQVRLPDGTMMTMREWLRAELAKLEAKAKPGR